MGQPVKIVQALSPAAMSRSKFIGIKPGERLHEILFAREEPTSPTGNQGGHGVAADQPIARGDAWLARRPGAGLAHGLTLGDFTASCARRCRIWWTDYLNCLPGGAIFFRQAT